MTRTRWENPGTPMARAVETKREPRDYLEPALAALGKPALDASHQRWLATSPGNPQLISAIIIAQALDRLAASMTNAAAIGNYKRE